MKLLPGQRLHVRVAAGWQNASVAPTLWRPGTKTLAGRAGIVARTARPGRAQRLSYSAQHGGWYDLVLRAASHGGGGYALDLTKGR